MTPTTSTNGTALRPLPPRGRWALLVLAGLAGTCLIVVGALQPSSPFTSKLPGSWFMGLPAHPLATGPTPWTGVVPVYGGIALLLASWVLLVGQVDRHVGMRRLWVVLGMWAAPLVVAPPLFSRDAYAYVADGQLVSSGLNPYTHGVDALGSSRFVHLVDPLWRTTHAAYGPLFLDVVHADVSLTGHTVVAAIVGMRVLAALALAACGACVAAITRSLGHHPARPFALAVLNPLALLYLLAGMHNDVLMLALLLAGVAMATRRHPAIAVVLCAAAASVKLPAALGVVFIAWDWGRRHPGSARRWATAAGAMGLAAAAAALVTLGSGFGWGWLVSGSVSGNVVSWLDPSTALGLAVGRAVQAAGLGRNTHAAVLAARSIGLVVAAAVSLRMVVRPPRGSLTQGLGWGLLSFAVLGPVVWPWYESWGVALLAVGSTRIGRAAIFAVSAIACYATFPSHLALSNGETAFLIASVTCVTGIVGVDVLRRSRSPLPRRAIAGRPAVQPAAGGSKYSGTSAAGAGSGSEPAPTAPGRC